MQDEHKYTSLQADSSAGRGAAPQGVAPFRSGGKRPTACVYVDGFNLYFGALKGTPLRWLNPVAIASKLFPKFCCESCKYFSARVSQEAGNEAQGSRQSTYWRALRTVERLEIIEGHFHVRRTWARTAHPPPEKIEIIRAEEKGSDVNLASHLLTDSLSGEVDLSIVITGDSDLATPIEMLTGRFGKKVGVINPQRLSGPNRRRCRGSGRLKSVATYYRGGITWSQLHQSQFQREMKDIHGLFCAPDGWTE